jgi:hypothetical protein
VGGPVESETEKRRHQARDYIATHPTIISPDSIFRKIWDGSQIFLLVYVAVAVPYRLAFNKIVILWSSWFFFDGFILHYQFLSFIKLWEFPSTTKRAG